jgi:hypothetical protein
MYDDSHSDCREPDRKDDEAEDGRPVVSEISWRCVVRGIEQHWRDEDCQRKLGRYDERGCAREECEERAAKCQKDWIGCADASRRCRQENSREDETNESFEFPHDADETARALELFRVATCRA